MIYRHRYYSQSLIRNGFTVTGYFNLIFLESIKKMLFQIKICRMTYIPYKESEHHLSWFRRLLAHWACMESRIFLIEFLYTYFIDSVSIISSTFFGCITRAVSVTWRFIYLSIFAVSVSTKTLFFKLQASIMSICKQKQTKQTCLELTCA